MTTFKPLPSPAAGSSRWLCRSNEDGFESHITNVRAAFHNLRLRAHRLLALLSLFDVLFSFITWALVSQVSHHHRRLHMYPSKIRLPTKYTRIELQLIFLLACTPGVSW